MNEYIVDIKCIEELKMINNLKELELIFAKAKSIIVQGGTFIITRENEDGTEYNVERMTREDDLKIYNENAWKYIV